MDFIKFIFKSIYKSLIIILLFFFILILGNVKSTYASIVYVNERSDVLTDLSNDESFDTSLYEIKSDDYSFSLIQFAESEYGYLYIYLYQPSSNENIVATEILLSVGENSTDYISYDLKLLNRNGVFQKYKVEGFLIPNEVYRYYNILEVERPFDPTIDEHVSGETFTDTKAYPIGYKCCAYWLNDLLYYEMEEIDVVEIQPVFTGYGFLEDGFTLSDLIGISGECHAHFIAFNVTNYDVDKIIDADIVWSSREYKKSTTYDYTKLDEEESPETTIIYEYPNGEEFTQQPKFFISSEQKASYKGDGLLAKEYSWDRISTAENFVSKVKSQDGVFSLSESVIKQAQFVFAFAETAAKLTEYNTSASDGTIFSTTKIIEGVEIQNVDIVRLHFLVGVKSYNLGVVMDKTHGDLIPDFGASGLDIPDLEEMFKLIMKIISIIILVILFIILFPFIKFIVKIIFNIFKIIFETIIFIIKLPFELIAHLFSSRNY